MTIARVTGLRSIDLAVRDLRLSKRFYEEIWGLQEVQRAPGVSYLRAEGPNTMFLLSTNIRGHT